MSSPTEPGTVGEEAARLLDAVQHWARDALGSPHLATGTPECTACPICQAVAVLRGERPEVNQRIVDLADAAAAFLRVARRPSYQQGSGSTEQVDVPGPE